VGGVEILFRRVGDSRVAFDQNGAPSGSDGGDARCSAAGKRVKEDGVARSECANEVCKEQSGLAGGMPSGIPQFRYGEELVEPRIDRLCRQHVRGISACLGLEWRALGRVRVQRPVVDPGSALAARPQRVHAARLLAVAGVGVGQPRLFQVEGPALSRLESDQDGGVRRLEPARARGASRREHPYGQVVDVESRVLDRHGHAVIGPGRADHDQRRPGHHDPPDRLPIGNGRRCVPIELEDSVRRIGEASAEGLWGKGS